MNAPTTPPLPSPMYNNTAPFIMNVPEKYAHSTHPKIKLYFRDCIRRNFEKLIKFVEDVKDNDEAEIEQVFDYVYTNTQYFVDMDFFFSKPPPADAAIPPLSGYLHESFVLQSLFTIIEHFHVTSPVKGSVFGYILYAYLNEILNNGVCHILQQRESFIRPCVHMSYGFSLQPFMQQYKFHATVTDKLVTSVIYRLMIIMHM